MPHKNDSADRDVFFATLALYDRDERELRQRVLPGDTDVEAVVEAAFARALGNLSLLPM
jgi:hypothetical protein